MYEGLFGDLPAAKNSKKNEEASRGSFQAPSNHGIDEDGRIAGTTTSNDVSKTTATATRSTKLTFVPTSAMRKGFKRSSNVSKIRAFGGNMLHPLNGFAEMKSSTPQSAVPLPHRSPHTKSQSSISSTFASTSIVHSLNSSALQAQDSSLNSCLNVTVHGDSHVSILDSSETDFTVDVDSDGFYYDDEERNRQFLHPRVKDSYDPLVPNDLQHVIDLRTLEEKNEELERQRREAAEHHERLRYEADDPHTQTYSTARSKNDHRNDSFSCLGRGRGRGCVSNLPAWMTL